MGGLSAERQVSLRSGNRIMSALRDRKVDAVSVDANRTVMQQLATLDVGCAFIALHGRWGEDGVIQGALEVAGIPYTGSGVLGSALAMDKHRTKTLWRGAGVPTPDYRILSNDDSLREAADELGFPMFVKPSQEGSSIGVTKVENLNDLQSAWNTARQYDDTVLAECFVDGPELTIGVLGEEALPIIKLETPRAFYDYAAKYESDATVYHCPCGLDKELELALQDQALGAFRLLDCSGWGRVDLMLDRHEEPYLLEVNTVPGMTDHSLVPMAARIHGLDFGELVMRILETG